MGKDRFGECHICGKYGALTFEHIPPRNAFNKHSVKLYNGFEAIHKSNGEPAKYCNSQQGMGRYSLCQSCNNNTGTWYAQIYCQFVADVMSAIVKSAPLKHGDVVKYEFRECPILPIAKQIISMFCSQLPYKEVHRLGFDELLLEKESNEVNRELFDLRMYLTSPEVGAYMSGLTSVILKNNASFDTVQVSELCVYPFGFILNLSPEIPVEYGGSIMDMFNVKYDDKCDFELSLMYLEKYSNKLPLPLIFKELPV